MSPETRRNWVRKHCLLEPGPFTQHDAVETAVAAAFTEGTTTQRSTAAFKVLRGDLREEVMAGHIDLWAIVPLKGRRFSLARSATVAAALAAELRGAEGPAWLVPLAAPIKQAQERYLACVASEDAVPGEIQELHGAGRSG